MRALRRCCFVLSFVVCGLGGALAGAETPGAVSVGDLPGTDRRWQMGQVTVPVPAPVVQRWFSEADHWAARFPDDKWARDLGRTPDGRHVAEFHSNAIGRTLTVRMREQQGLITYDGSGKGITTQGKIFIEPAGPGQTKVIMQTTGELRGFAGAFAPESVKRKRAIKKLTADLNALVRLSNEYAAAARQKG
jgi:hypothetical protein